VKVELAINQEGFGACTVYREEGDPKCSGVVNAAGESRLLYHMKRILNAEGHRFIKTRMHKHGHLMSDMQQYIYDRHSGIAIYNGYWQIRGAEEDFNNDGKTVFAVENLKKEAA